jgi:hypothetical protein
MKMASNGNDSGGLSTAGGVLSIVAGAFEIHVVMMMVASVRYCMTIWSELWFFSFRFWPLSTPEMWCWEGEALVPTWLIIVEGLLLALGIIAIVGGISAIRRRRFGLSLAGAICALPSGIFFPSVILGILAIVCVALGRKEFRAKA